MIYLTCRHCPNTIGVLPGSSAWCWGSGLKRHAARLMRKARP